MANRLARALASLGEFLARLWPISRTEDQVLRRYEDTHPELPPAGEGGASG